MPTDTLYGIVARAESREVVERIYGLRKRNSDKPCIILVGDLEEIKKFGIVLTEAEQNEIQKYNEPTSFVIDCLEEKFAYLHRGTHTLAFRMPVNAELKNLLLQTGPLVAPSANLEGLPPAHTIEEAKKYFGHGVDLYIDAGTINANASKVIKLHKDGTTTILRA